MSTNPSSGNIKTECVKVAVRVRPLNFIEKSERAPSIISSSAHQILINRPNNEQKAFTFDYVYMPNVAQNLIFVELARPIVDSVLSGYNGTIFAYGQTGTGKTYTMEGDVDSELHRGIMPNTFIHIFKQIEDASQNIEYLVRVAFIEIYNDDVFDLLNNDKTKLTLKEAHGGFKVRDLTMHTVHSPDDTMKTLRMGQRNRSVGATKMNPGSSRSHSIFTVTIEACEKDAHGVAHYRAAKLNMVDLAGSERQKKTEATGDRLVEAKNINLSLSALGNVINALVKPKSGHVPFRDSKLTRLLQDSLGGNTRTVMIAAVGPADSNLDETMSTLRYAHRAKGIMNAPVINEDPKDAMLRQYQEEIDALKRQLEEKRQSMEGSEMQLSEVVENVVIRHEMTDEQRAELEKQTHEELARFKSLHEHDKKKILASKTEAEKQALLFELELERSRQQHENERAEIATLEGKLKERETSLLVGGQEIQQAEEQHRRLMKTEERLQEQLEKERQLQRHLEEAEEAKLYMNEQYSSRQDELEKKTKKLKSLWAKYKEKVDDLKDIQSEFELQSEDLMESIRDLTGDLTVKNCILTQLVSKANRHLLEREADWNPYSEEWTIRHNTRPSSVSKGHQRLSTYERIAALLDKDARHGGIFLQGSRSASANNTALNAALHNLKLPTDISYVYFTYSGSRLRNKARKAKANKR